MQQWLDLVLAVGGLLNVVAALTNLTTAIVNGRTASREHLTNKTKS